MVRFDYSSPLAHYYYFYKWSCMVPSAPPIEMNAEYRMATSPRHWEWIATSWCHEFGSHFHRRLILSGDFIVRIYGRFLVFLIRIVSSSPPWLYYISMASCPCRPSCDDDPLNRHAIAHSKCEPSSFKPDTAVIRIIDSQTTHTRRSLVVAIMSNSTVSANIIFGH